MGNASGRWAGAVVPTTIMTVIIVAATVWLGSGPAGAVPRLNVSPKLHLADGAQISVQASGLPPGVEARINECDQFNDDVELDCSDRATVTANDRGRFATTLDLVDPVIRSQPFGDGTPVYCRADNCRIFVVWKDAQGTTQVLTSQRLWFLGAPATITATPSSDLRKDQVVRASGTAFGAQGHTVEIVEEACFQIIQGSGCYGTLPAVRTKVHRDGSWSRNVTVHRYLSDGTDCPNIDFLGSCQLTVRVLDAHGQPDDTFGISSIGDPGASLTFLTS